MEFIVSLVGFLGFGFRGGFRGSFCGGFSSTDRWLFDEDALVGIVCKNLTIGTRLIIGNFERAEVFVFEVSTNFRLEEEF